MKQFTSCLLILAVIFSLAACHGDHDAPLETTASTTETTAAPTETTAPLIMADVYVLIKDMNNPTSITSLKIVLFEDGTYYSNQHVYSSNGPVEGEWKVEDGYLYLYWSGMVHQQPTERMSKFRFQDRVLTFIKKSDDDEIQDISSMFDIEDGANYIYAGTAHKNPSN